MKRIILLITIQVLLTYTLVSGDTFNHYDNNLNLFISAYSLGMGGATGAQGNGLGNALNNPAALANSNLFEVGANSGVIMGYRTAFTAGAIWHGALLGLGVDEPRIHEYFHTDDQNENTLRDRYGIKGGGLFTGYGMNFTEWLKGGAILSIMDVKVVPPRDEDNTKAELGSGSTTLHLGLQGDFNWLHLGLAARNLGGGNRTTRNYPGGKDILDFTPARVFSLSTAYEPLKNLVTAIQLDANQSQSEIPFVFKLGAEYGFTDWLWGRIGYNDELSVFDNGGFSLGAGFRFTGFLFDLGYAYGGRMANAGRNASSLLIDASYFIPYSQEKKGATSVGRPAGLDKQTLETINLLKSNASKFEASGDLQSARENYDFVLVRNPGDEEAQQKLTELDKKIKQAQIDKHLSAGNAFLASLAYSDAYKEASEALRLDPANENAITLMNQTKAAMEESRTSTKENVIKLMDDALVALDNDEYSRAIGIYTEIIKADPSNRDATMAIVRTQSRLENFKKNVLGKAQSAEEEKKYQNALALYQKLLKADSGSTEAVAGIERCQKALGERINRLNDDGINLFNQGAYNEAESYFRTVLNLEPGNNTAKSYLGRIDEKRREKNLPPPTRTDYSRTYQMGVAAYTDRDYAAAIGYWNQIPQSDPYYSKAQININRAQAILAELNQY